MNLFSPEFILFFLTLFFGYWLISPWPRLQNLLLLCSSYIFVCQASPLFASILLVWSLVIHGIALSANRGLPGKGAIALTWLLVVAMFVIFKYYGAIREALILPVDLPVLNILMPLGLSFYLFNSVSYVVSVAKKQIEPPTFLDAHQPRHTATASAGERYATPFTGKETCVPVNHLSDYQDIFPQRGVG